MLLFDNRTSVSARYRHRRAYYDGFKTLAFNWEVHRSIILMGPRRVGKTVMLHQLIDEALTDGFPPKGILFASIDTPLYSGLPLQRLVDLFEDQSDLESDGRRLVIFDEVQYLKDWEVHLKVLTDQYPNTRFIASGSAAAALRLKSNESGAGRFTDYFLPPLTFAEFLDFSDLEEDLIEEPDEGRKYGIKDINALNSAFIDYLNYGGYPEAVVSPAIRADAQRFLGRDIIDKVLLRDLPSLYGIQNIQELNRLFTTIAYHTGQEISLEKLASSSGVAKPTITRYMEYLEAAFLIIRVKRVDSAGQQFKRMVNFKVYLANPSMRAALFAPIDADDPAMGTLVETAYFGQWLHSPDLPHLYYARWKEGRTDMEVDLVYVREQHPPDWAMELKWSDHYVNNPNNLKGLISFAQRNPSPVFEAGASSRTQFQETEVSGVYISHQPVALLCYAMGKNSTKQNAGSGAQAHLAFRRG
ncbi:MAG: ATP-binding protein [Rhodospirillum sp.]|nr:ATP-binding protein [Rhodospirillum sp.]